MNVRNMPIYLICSSKEIYANYTNSWQSLHKISFIARCLEKLDSSVGHLENFIKFLHSTLFVKTNR